jgi:hypothetical protein
MSLKKFRVQPSGCSCAGKKQAKAWTLNFLNLLKVMSTESELQLLTIYDSRLTIHDSRLSCFLLLRYQRQQLPIVKSAALLNAARIHNELSAPSNS